MFQGKKAKGKNKRITLNDIDLVSIRMHLFSIHRTPLLFLLAVNEESSQTTKTFL